MRIKISKMMAEYMVKNFKDRYAINVMPLTLWENGETLLLINGDKILKLDGRYYLELLTLEHLYTTNPLILP